MRNFMGKYSFLHLSHCGTRAFSVPTAYHRLSASRTAADRVPHWTWQPAMPQNVKIDVCRASVLPFSRKFFFGPDPRNHSGRHGMALLHEANLTKRINSLCIDVLSKDKNQQCTGNSTSSS